MAYPASKAKGLGQSLFFVDESGFYPLPAVPRGQTPVLREWCTREHLSMIATVSAQGQLHAQVRGRAFDAVAGTEFLRHLLRTVPGPVLVIWDGAPIHRSKVVKAFLQTEAGGRLELEPLPGDAPDLNPLDCGVWHWLKNVALANVCATDLGALKQELRAAIVRLRAGFPPGVRAARCDSWGTALGRPRKPGSGTAGDHRRFAVFDAVLAAAAGAPWRGFRCQ